MLGMSSRLSSGTTEEHFSVPAFPVRAIHPFYVCICYVYMYIRIESTESEFFKEGSYVVVLSRYLC